MPLSRTVELILSVLPMKVSAKAGVVLALAIASLVVPEVRADIRPGPVSSGLLFGQAIAAARVGNKRIIAIGQAGASRRVTIMEAPVEGDDSTIWLPRATLVPPGTVPDSYARSIAMRAGPDGSVLVAVGAPSDAVVSLFRRAANGAWSFEQQLFADQIPSPGGFGEALAISQDLSRIAVGAPDTDFGGIDSAGLVSVYRRVAGSYQFSAFASQPVPSNPDGSESIGAAVAFVDVGVGQRPELLIGAPDAPGTGKVHVVRESAPGTWIRVKTLTRPQGFGDFRFGSAIASAGDTAVVGMQLSGFAATGSAFALRRTQGSWSIEAELAQPDTVVPGAFYGTSVAVEGTLAMVGSFGGFVHVHRRLPNGAWVPHERVEPSTAETIPTQVGSSRFGASIAVASGVLAIGAPFRTVNGFSNVGVVSVTEIGARKILSPDRASDGYFGYALGMSGRRCAIGSPTAIVSVGGTAVAAGSVRVLERVGSTWREEAVFSGTQEIELFGAAVDMPDEDTVVVTAPGFRAGDSFERGTVSVFRRAGPGVWQQSSFNGPTPTVGTTNNFGHSLDVVRDGDAYLIAVGAMMLSNGAGNPNVGGVFVLRFANSGFGPSFVEIQRIFAPAPISLEFFGRCLTMEQYGDGTVDLWVGASNTTVGPDGAQGSLRLFRRSPGASVFNQVGGNVIPSGANASEALAMAANSIAMRGSLLVVGVPLDDSVLSLGSGMARVFRRAANGTWTQLSGVIRGTAPESGPVGVCVATNGTLVAVARPGDRSIVLVKPVGSALQVVRTAVFNDADPATRFGSSLAIGPGGTPAILVGVEFDDVGDLDNAGAAYFADGTME